MSEKYSIYIYIYLLLFSDFLLKIIVYNFFLFYENVLCLFSHSSFDGYSTSTYFFIWCVSVFDLF